jgi:hypothetical protein
VSQILLHHDVGVPIPVDDETVISGNAKMVFGGRLDVEETLGG